jgi:hypothetical protein
VLRAEVSPELVDRRSILDIGKPDGGGDQRQDGVSVGRREEIDEEDTVGEPVDLVGGSAKSKTGLSSSPRPGQRDEPDLGGVEALAEVLEHGLAADERRRLAREVVRSAIEGRQGWKLGRQVPLGNLEEAFGPAQILQPVLAQIPQRYGGNATVDQTSGGARQQDLAAMTRRHDARCPVDGGAEEIPAARLSLSRMDPDPDADRAAGRPRFAEEGPLGRDRGRHRGDRPGEHGHETVAGRLDDGSVGIGDRVSEEGLMPCKSALHLLRVLLP